MESLYAELVSNNVIQPIPKTSMKDFVGGFNYLGATLEKANIIPDASLSQACPASPRLLRAPLVSNSRPLVSNSRPLVSTSRPLVSTSRPL
eukprot:33278-Pyramimonas_sp.AAC.1